VKDDTSLSQTYIAPPLWATQCEVPRSTCTTYVLVYTLCNLNPPENEIHLSHSMLPIYANLFMHLAYSHANMHPSHSFVYSVRHKILQCKCNHLGHIVCLTCYLADVCSQYSLCEVVSIETCNVQLPYSAHRARVHCIVAVRWFPCVFPASCVVQLAQPPSIRPLAPIYSCPSNLQAGGVQLKATCRAVCGGRDRWQLQAMGCTL
jgi:hypothetical protein